MCGVAGCAGRGINTYDLDILADMTFVLGLRGMDGTGIFQVDIWGNKVKTLLEKSTWGSPYFRSFHKYSKEGNKDAFSGLDNCVFAVHARSATRGGLTDENCHPFEFSRYIGMHNGTLVDDKYKHETKTDSELLIADINERGVEEVLRELSPQSAYALVLFDKETKELIFARNEHRPLCFAVHEKRHTLYWASERWMIAGMTDRNDEVLHKQRVQMIHPGMVYRCKPNEPFNNKDDLFRRTNIQTGKPVVIAQATQAPQVLLPPPQQQAGVLGPIGQFQQEIQTQIQVIKAKEGQKETVGKVFTKKICPGCNGEMSLLDQYFGQKFGKTTIMHKHCAN